MMKGAFNPRSPPEWPGSGLRTLPRGLFGGLGKGLESPPRLNEEPAYGSKRIRQGLSPGKDSTDRAMPGDHARPEGSEGPARTCPDDAPPEAIPCAPECGAMPRGD